MQILRVAEYRVGGFQTARGLGLELACDAAIHQPNSKDQLQHHDRNQWRHHLGAETCFHNGLSSPHALDLCQTAWEMPLGLTRLAPGDSHFCCGVPMTQPAAIGVPSPFFPGVCTRPWELTPLMIISSGVSRIKTYHSHQKQTLSGRFLRYFCGQRRHKRCLTIQ